MGNGFLPPDLGQSPWAEPLESTECYSVDEIRVFFHPTTPPRDGHVEPWSQVLALTAVGFLLLLRGHLTRKKP